MIRIGVIGGGMIGRDHIEGLNRGGAEITALAEPIDERRKEVQEEYGIPDGYADGEELVEKGNVEAVSIGTPNALHKPQTIAALKKGLHVLCEKPMAMNAGESVEMIEAAHASGKLLMMAFNQMFNPGIWKMMELREQGVFGEVYHGRTTQIRQSGDPSSHGSWFTDAKMAGAGITFDLASHSFYRAWYAMGKPVPVSVSGAVYQKFVSGDVDDFSAALIRFEGGRTLLLEASWEAARIDQGKRTMIMGTKGGADYRAEQEAFTLVRKEAGSAVEEEIDLGPVNAGSKYQHFVDCLEKKIPCLCPAADGYIVQLVLDSILRSSKDNREIAIELDPVVLEKGVWKPE